MTVQQSFQQLLQQLYEIYEDREANNIADLVIEKVTGLRKIDRILNNQTPVNARHQQQLDAYTAELMQHKPVQYVVQEAWFYQLPFYVDEKVLIPRPETEELVDWIVKDYRNKLKVLEVIDVGSGSGCIAVSLASALATAIVTAVDVNEHALAVISLNARMNNVEAVFPTHIDFLDVTDRATLDMFDIIVSNPPYIMQRESAEMEQHVLDYEPHLALFVPDNDPLLFYRNIAEFAATHLNDDGCIYLEINQALGQETAALFESAGYTVELRKDMQGKDRMVKAWKEHL
jgi:release factor glutamine methyltransferase